MYLKMYQWLSILVFITSGVSQMVDNLRDDNGCLSSAGYTWCDTTGACIREWKTPCPIYDSYLIDEPCPPTICDLTCPNGYIINDEGCSECLCVLEDYPDNCIYWFDGCNTCSISNGITVMCTVLKCITTDIPMCLLYSVTHE